LEQHSAQLTATQDSNLYHNSKIKRRLRILRINYSRIVYFFILSVSVFKLFFNNFEAMTPDFPRKRFNDKRRHYSLLMITLAMDVS
jgi:hypothetical protein